MSVKLITSAGNMVFWKFTVAGTLVVLLVINISHRGAVAETIRCNAWEFTEGSYCYQIYSINMTRREAWINCTAQNLTLIKIHSTRKKLLTKLEEVLLPSQMVWVGARRIQDKWYWDDGIPAVFYPLGEPRSALGKCAVFSAGKYIPTDCEEKHGFICGPGVSNIKKCGDWEFTEGYLCYPKYSSEMTRREAWTNCTAQNLSLVKIYGSLLNTKLEEELLPSQEVWIGARRIEDIWYWDDGEKVNFSRWGEPRSASGRCAVFSAGEWRQTDCEEKHGFVCGQGGSHDMEAWTRCSFLHQYPHKLLDDGCFWFIPGYDLSWDDAREICKQHNGDLLVITDYKTDSAVWDDSSFALEGQFVHLVHDYSEFWAGAKKHRAKTWKRVTSMFFPTNNYVILMKVFNHVLDDKDEMGLGWKPRWNTAKSIVSFFNNWRRTTDTCLMVTSHGWEEDNCGERHLFLCENKFLPAYSRAINFTTEMEETDNDDTSIQFTTKPKQSALSMNNNPGQATRAFSVPAETPTSANVATPIVTVLETTNLPEKTTKYRKRRNRRKDKKTAKVYALKGVGYIPGSAMFSTRLSAVTMCSRRCESTNGCKTFNYNTVTYQCRGFDVLVDGSATGDSKWTVWGAR